MGGQCKDHVRSHSVVITMLAAGDVSDYDQATCVGGGTACAAPIPLKEELVRRISAELGVAGVAGGPAHSLPLPSSPPPPSPSGPHSCLDDPKGILAADGEVKERLELRHLQGVTSTVGDGADNGIRKRAPALLQSLHRACEEELVGRRVPFRKPPFKELI